MRKTMRKLGYKNTSFAGIKRVYEKYENGYIIGIAYTEIGEICDYYVYKKNRKFTSMNDIDNLKLAYKKLLDDLRSLRNG